MDENAHITDPALRRYLGLAPQTFYNHQDGGWYRVSNDGYNPDQPRDDNGRWTQKGVAKSSKSRKLKIRRKVIALPIKEYAQLQSAFMTDVTREERKKKDLSIYYGNYRYRGILREDGTRDIISKRKINNV